MKIRLIRVEKADTAVIGVLTIDGRIVSDIYSLEHPELLVPEGEYPIVWEYSPKFECSLWELKEVHGRSECKFHRGTTMKDTEGCIILGSRVGMFRYPGEQREYRAVFHSGDAVEDLNDLLPRNETHSLKIIEI